MEQPYNPEQKGLFEDYIDHRNASTGQRFFNLLIDNLLMRFALSYATAYPVMYLLAYTSPEFVDDIANERSPFMVLLLSYILTVFNYLFYYTICEKAFRGYTLGKLLTGTRAIRDDNKELTFKDAFLRSASRLVPFEPFSGFAERPWHDQWTKTRVIKVR